MIRTNVSHARLLSILLLLVAAALLAAGCGDSSDDGADDASNSADAAQADATDDADETDDTDNADASADDAAQDALADAYQRSFAEISTQFEAVGEQFEAAEDIDDFKAATRTLQTTIASLNALTPPAAVEADHTRLYAALRKALVEIKKVTPTSTPESDEAAAAAAAAELDTAAEAVEAINAELG